jgi:hypothetical protein
MLRLVLTARSRRAVSLAARTARQARLEWAAAAAARWNLGPQAIEMDLAILTALGVPQAVAERTIHGALAAAGTAYRTNLETAVNAMASERRTAPTTPTTVSVNPVPADTDLSMANLGSRHQLWAEHQHIGQTPNRYTRPSPDAVEPTVSRPDPASRRTSLHTSETPPP